MCDIKFSVLIPVYNTEKYIASCIESVLNQTYQNFELIIIDDGSTDNSGLICDKYASSCDKIIVIHNQNKGLVLTRREGIKRATGDFVMFLDSDDCYRRDALEIINKNINQFNCDLAFFNASREEGFKNNDNDLGFHNNQIFEGREKELLYEKVITTTKLNNLCFKAVKRDLFDVEKNYNEYAVVTFGEDVLQSLPIIDKSKKAVYINESLYFYRQHGNSMVHNLTKKAYDSIIIANKVLAQYLVKWNMQKLISKYNSRIIIMSLKYANSIIFDKRKNKKERRDALKELFNDEYLIESLGSFDCASIKKKDLILIKLIQKKRVRIFYGLARLRKKISNIIH